MEKTDPDQKIGEDLTTRLQELATEWEEQEGISSGIIAVALATVAGNLALKVMGRQKTVEWFHELGDITEQEGCEDMEGIPISKGLIN